ncbi:hypothetical protein ACFE04_029815 [Oxalis oulophora]
MALIRIMFASLLLLSIVPQKSDAEYEQWCIADEQTPEDDLHAAMDWACKEGGANCTMIQENNPCFNPNTTKDHASFVFNNYFQKFKNIGGSCYFGGAAFITELDPSHDSCHYDYTPYV